MSLQKAKLAEMPVLIYLHSLKPPRVRLTGQKNMEKITFNSGQQVWVEGNSVCGLPDYLEEMGDNFLTWEGHGYSGGHVSQSHWDTDQQYKEALVLLRAGYEVYDATVRGSTGGYYPCLKYRKVT